ncbi:MAG: Uma2 family endonuclease [Candidatus Rokubacteria bacterium]|nr:Uma2 family endonuclease [Candidatus Rokubacteria bacterium]
MLVEVAVARRRFTREEYHRMGEAGILKPTERVELIRGEIVTMSPIGRRHVAFVDNLTQPLVVRLAGRAIVSVQHPIVLSDDTEPEPDIARPRSATTDRRSSGSTPKPGSPSTGAWTAPRRPSRSTAPPPPTAMARSVAPPATPRSPSRRSPTSP